MYILTKQHLIFIQISPHWKNWTKFICYDFNIDFHEYCLTVPHNKMLWCTELDTAENFGLTSIQKPLIAISKCPLLNIHPVHNS